MPTLYTFEIPPDSSDVLEAKLHGNAFAVLYSDYDANATNQKLGVVPELRIDHKRGQTYGAVEGTGVRRSESFSRIYLDPKTELIQTPNAPVVDEDDRLFSALRVTVYVWDHRTERVDIDAVRYPGPPTQARSVPQAIGPIASGGGLQARAVGYFAPHRPYRISALELNSNDDEDVEVRLQSLMMNLLPSGNQFTLATDIAVATYSSGGGGVNVRLSDFDLGFGDATFGPWQVPNLEVINNGASDIDVGYNIQLTPVS